MNCPHCGAPRLSKMELVAQLEEERNGTKMPAERRPTETMLKQRHTLGMSERYRFYKQQEIEQRRKRKA